MHISLIKSVFNINWYVRVILIFLLLLLHCITLIDFLYWTILTALRWIPFGHDELVSWCNLYSICQDYIEDSCIYVLKRYWSDVFLSQAVLFCFEDWNNIGFIECVWECYFFYNMSEIQDVINFSLKVLQKSQMKSGLFSYS